MGQIVTILLPKVNRIPLQTALADRSDNIMGVVAARDLLGLDAIASDMDSWTVYYDSPEHLTMFLLRWCGNIGLPNNV